MTVAPVTPVAPGKRPELRARAIRFVWAAGRPIARAHSHGHGSIQLDARTWVDHRFSPLRLVSSAGDGPVIPVLYGGQDEQAAASETIFHTVDTPTGAHRPRQVLLGKFVSWQWSRIEPTRDLVLVDLRDDGLAALGLARQALIDGGRPTYPHSRSWAHALIHACREVDGLLWDSRQDPSRLAVMLVGRVPGRRGGISSADLAPVGPAQPFALPDGLELLDRIADALDVTVLRP